MEAIVEAISRIDAVRDKAALDADVERRVRALAIIANHLSPTEDKMKLSEATHELRDIKDEAEMAAQQAHGRSGARQRAYENSSADRALVARLRRLAAELRSRRPNSSQAERALWLRAQFPGRWPSAKALKMWAHRRCIEI